MRVHFPQLLNLWPDLTEIWKEQRIFVSMKCQTGINNELLLRTFCLCDLLLFGPRKSLGLVAKFWPQYNLSKRLFKLPWHKSSPGQAAALSEALATPLKADFSSHARALQLIFSDRVQPDHFSWILAWSFLGTLPLFGWKAVQVNPRCNAAGMVEGGETITVLATD